MSTYNEQKRRRIENLARAYDHDPSQSQIIQTLIGSDNIKKVPHPTKDKVELWRVPCPREGHAHNDYSKLCTCY